MREDVGFRAQRRAANVDRVRLETRVQLQRVREVVVDASGASLGLQRGGKQILGHRDLPLKGLKHQRAKCHAGRPAQFADEFHREEVGALQSGM